MIESRCDVWVGMVLAALAGAVIALGAALAAARRRAVEAAELRALVDAQLDGLIVCDERAVIEYANPAAGRMFGFAPNELVGRNVLDLTPPSAAPDPAAFLREARKRAMGQVTEWEGRHRNGSLFPFELSLFEFSTSGSLGRRNPSAKRRFAGCLRDLSDRTRLERLKKQFVATVSHELRTPLTSIRGSLGLLSGGALGELPDEALGVVTIAERNSVRLIALINDILDLERSEQGRLELVRTCLEPPALLEQAADTVRGMACERGIDIRTTGSARRMSGDGQRLIQVLANLLSNAVKFAPRGSSVELSCSEVEGSVEFKVADRGRGVPREQRETIFEPFVQVEAGDARVKGGSGLGLAISRTIVQQHGGTIGVSERPGGGSVFWFRIPAPEQAVDPLVVALREGFGTDSTDVLLAGSDTALQGVLTRQLLQAGLSVRGTDSGRLAVDLAAQLRPGLIVLDPGLSDLSGSAVVSALRDGPAAGTPLLVYGEQDLSDAERGELTLGGTRFMTQSRVSDAQFLAAIREMLPA